MRFSPSRLLHICFLFWFIILCYVISYWLFLPEFNSFQEYSSFILNLFETGYQLDGLTTHFLEESNYILLTENLNIIRFSVLSFAVSIILYYKWINNKFNTQNRLKLDLKPFASSFFISFLLIWIGLKVALYFYLPLHVDEVFDFVFYSKNDLITRHTYQFTDGRQWYNNHIFYCDVSNFFHTIGFGDKLSIRLPSILAELVLLSTVYYSVRNSSFTKKCITLAFLALSFWSGIYSVQGRSYMMVACFTFCSFLTIRSYIYTPNKSKFLLLLLFSLLGFASLKIYTVSFFGLMLYALIISRKDFFQLHFHHLILLVILGTAFFYMPVVLIGGLENAYTTTIVSDAFLTEDLLETFSFITNVNTKAYLFLPVYLLFFVLIRKQLNSFTLDSFYFLIILIGSYLLFSFIAHDYLPFRSIVFINQFFCFSLALSVSDLTTKFRKQDIVISLSILLFAANTYYNYQFSWVKNYNRYVLGKELYTELDQSLKLIEEANPKRIVLKEQDFFFHFYHLYRNNNPEIFFFIENEADYKPEKGDVFFIQTSANEDKFQKLHTNITLDTKVIWVD